MGLCIGMSVFLNRIFFYKLGSGMITDVCLFIIGITSLFESFETESTPT